MGLPLMKKAVMGAKGADAKTGLYFVLYDIFSCSPSVLPLLYFKKRVKDFFISGRFYFWWKGRQTNVSRLMNIFLPPKK